MKLKAKLLMPLAGVAAIAATTPFAITACSTKTADIETLNGKEHTLDSNYYTGELYFSIAKKFAFEPTEKDKHIIRFTFNNLKYNDKVLAKPTLAYSGSWSKDEKTQKCNFYKCKMFVSDVTLQKGAEITFDLIGQFGQTDGTTFTPVSNEVNFGNWKFKF